MPVIVTAADGANANIPRQIRDNNDPSLPNLAFNRILPSWRMIESLMGGTQVMRLAGETYLPREMAESLQAYNNRLKRSFLFNAFERTVRTYASKPFRKPVTIGEDVPETIRVMLDNVDQRGNSATVFAAGLLQTFLQYGACHILSDYPETGDGMTMADANSRGMRPYWVPIMPTQLIGWRYSDGLNGQAQLEQIRIMETVTEQAGKFGETSIEQVRVIERDTWAVYRKSRTGKSWILHSEGVNRLGFIPLASAVWGDSDDRMVGDLPLENLAWLNVEHWQSSSDQRHILHVARVPILHWAGAPANEEGEKVEVGANRVIKSSDPNAKLSFVEHSGHAIGAGRTDILDIEERMAMMGLDLITRKPGEPTATGKAIDEARGDSQLALMVERLNDCINNALAHTSAIIGGSRDDGGTVHLFKDFSILADGIEMGRMLLEMRRAGEISRETFLGEIARRGIFKEDFDPDLEAAIIDEEQAALRAADPGLEDEPGDDTLPGGE